MENGNSKKLTVISYFLGIIVAVILVYLLAAFRNLLIPIVIAVFLTYLFFPILDWMNKKIRIPKGLGIILIFIFNFAIFYLIGLLFYSSFAGFSVKLEAYGQMLSKIIQDILSPFNITLTEIAQMFGIETEKFNAGNLIKKLFDAGIIQNLLSSFSDLFSNFFIVMLFWVFMIMGKTKFEDRLKIALKDSSVDVSKTLNSINDQLQSYLLIKTAVSLATGITFTIILYIYGIPFAMIWGFLAFVMNYIPNVGSLIATVFPILIGMLEYGLGLTSISLAAVLVIVQQIFGNMIEPKLLGSKMDLSTVFILLSLVFWGWVWGIVGMFLAVPIASVMKILCSNIEPLKPIAIIMGTKAEPIN
ncbi:AI-2 transport protein TqsA [bacterium BMS3Abin03]|nr:AI-2 transport protein TqsA [bacterium BMS3Abin03]